MSRYASSRRFASVALSSVSLSLAAGCAMSAAPASESDTISSALATELGTWTSGDLTTKAWRCEPTPPLTAPQTSCPIPDPNFVMIGGGAEIVGSPAAPAAALRSSYPSTDGSNEWRAESAGIGSTPVAHSLQAYVIGLQIAGVTSDQLRSQVVINRSNNGPSSQVLVSGALLGGGARAISAGGSTQFLTKSVPSGGSWIAISVSSPLGVNGSVEAYAISISNPCFQAGKGCLSARSTTLGTPIFGGYGSQTLGVKSLTGAVLTGIGGVANWDGQPRYLSDLIVTGNPSPGAQVGSYGSSFASGNTIAWVFGLSR